MGRQKYMRRFMVRLKDKTRLEAHLLVPQLTVNYKNSIQLAAKTHTRGLREWSSQPSAIDHSRNRDGSNVSGECTSVERCARIDVDPGQR